MHREIFRKDESYEEHVPVPIRPGEKCPYAGIQNFFGARFEKEAPASLKKGETERARYEELLIPIIPELLVE